MWRAVRSVARLARQMITVQPDCFQFSSKYKNGTRERSAKPRTQPISPDARDQRREPFTEKHLLECYQRAAARFGWSKRSYEPGSMRNGHELIGWGMATETYPGKNLPASGLVRFQPDGRIVVASGTQEIGTGNYTILAEVAADVLRVPVAIIEVRLGDTNLPPAPISAGSMSTASVTPAVQAASEEARRKLIAMAVADQASPVYGARSEDVDFAEGKVVLKSDSSKGEGFVTILKRHGNQPLEATAATKPILDPQTPCDSFGAVFAEVSVDADLGMTRVKRVVAVYDVGRLVNKMTARSQFIGGIVWGISLALEEDTHVDWRYGRITNANLADYHIPVNADIEEIDVSAIDIPDYRLDSMGARGVGEIGITGTAAAVANAIFHAKTPSGRPCALHKACARKRTRNYHLPIPTHRPRNLLLIPYLILQNLVRT
jgi:xanthine dehydrogenase YagR molybdenum-binding subunit